MSRPDGVTYFYGYFKGGIGSRGLIALRFTGTRAPAPIREGSVIDAEIRIDAEPTQSGYPARFWANVEAALVVKEPNCSSSGSTTIAGLSAGGEPIAASAASTAF